MAERDQRSGRATRMTAAAPAPPVRRVRVMSSGLWHPPVTEQMMQHLVVVGSAGPGAGKSIIASNLATAIAGMGQQVVVADLDRRMPRQHALLGAAPPAAGLSAWTEERRNKRDAAPVGTRVRNLRLLPYAGGGPVGDPQDDRRAIAEGLYDVGGDVVVIDLGSSSRDDLFDFFATRAVRLLVTAVDRPALEETYAFLKTIALRAERKHGASARAVLAQLHGGLVGNWISTPAEAESLHAFSRLVRAHLGMPLPVVGWLAGSERVLESAVRKQPLVARRGMDENVHAFHQIAEWILGNTDGLWRQCRLDGTEPAVPPGPLPADVADYERKHHRFPVDWAATLELPSGATAVRVRDVSESGAGIETQLPLQLGDPAILHFDQIPGQPALAVTVRNALPAIRRAGLGFVEPGDVPKRLLAAATKDAND